MTNEQILDVVEEGYKITLPEFDRLERRIRKLRLEIHRLEKGLERVRDADGRPIVGRVTSQEMFEDRPRCDEEGEK